MRDEAKGRAIEPYNISTPCIWRLTLSIRVECHVVAIGDAQVSNGPTSVWAITNLGQLLKTIELSLLRIGPQIISHTLNSEILSSIDKSNQ